MAEVVGVVAAAAQLATVSLSLLEMTRKIKGMSKTLENYNQNFEELHSLSNSISQNPLLQTPEIGVCTESILSILKANSLTSLTQKNHWHRTWYLLSREKDLQETLVNLEQRKASLSLIVEHLQARALHEIQSDIRTMCRTPIPPTKAFDDAPHIDNRDQRSDEQGQLQLVAKPSAPTTSEVILHQTPTQEASGNNTGKISEKDAYYEDLHRARREAKKAKADMAKPGSLYLECKAESGSLQINGPSVSGPAANASYLAGKINFDGEVVYVGCKLEGNSHFDGNATQNGSKTADKGRQVNGKYLSLTGPLCGEDELSMSSINSTWARIVCGEQAIQVNGNVVDVSEDPESKGL